MNWHLSTRRVVREVVKGREIGLGLKVQVRVGKVEKKREDVNGKKIFRCECTNEFSLCMNSPAEVECCY